MPSKTIDITHAQTLNIADLLAYIVEIYGKEIYLQPKRLVGLLADLMNTNEGNKRIYRRAIIDDQIAEKIYRIVTEYNEDEIRIKQLTKQFEEINAYRTQIAESVINNFLYAITDISTKATNEDIEFIYNYNTEYSQNGKKLIKLAYGDFDGYEIREGTKIICDNAFWGCKNLQTINLPNSLTHIGNSAFSGCTNLNTIDVSSNNLNFRSIDGVLYSYDLTRLIRYPAGKNSTSFSVPNGVIRIEDSAFGGCIDLKTINLPNSLTHIGDRAFYGCYNLQTINLPNSLTHIGYRAFYRCMDLHTIHLPDSLTHIGDSAFYDCKKLQTIKLPDSLTHIGESAFYDCSNLQAIDISSNNLNFRSIDGVLYSYDLTRLIWYPRKKESSSFSVPNGVIRIEDSAFYDCINLQTIHLPDSLTHIGKRAFYDCKKLQTIHLPDSLTHIGESAFNGCENLQTINLPDSLTHIGNSAFSWCSNLKAIDISSNNLNFRSIDGVLYSYDLTRLISYPAGKNSTSFSVPNGVIRIEDSAFGGCSNLKTIRLPKSLTHIGNKAFSRCSNLQTIKLPDSLTHIGDSAFYWCVNLQTINLPDSLTHIGSYAFYGCMNLQTINLPDSLTNIRNGVFDRCENLKTIKLPDSLTHIGDSAFSWCENLQTIDVSSKNLNFRSIDGVLYSYDLTRLIRYPRKKESSSFSVPNGVIRIEDSAFGGCINLQTIHLPDTLTDIGDSAFYGCEKLHTIHLPDSLTHIGNSAFRGCKNLHTINLPNSLTHIGNSVFMWCYNLKTIDVSSNNLNFRSVDGVLYSYDLTRLIWYPRKKESSSFSVPNGVIRIEDSAFSYCKNLQKVHLSEQLIHIGNEAFYGCNHLQTIHLPDSLTHIGESAFYWCENLQTIHLPDSLTHIGDSAFSWCSNLKTIYIPKGTKERFVELLDWREANKLVEI